ncbi:hypothetical protein CJ030_MR3G021773 [Morella rubra]|uniref:Uncharacterized protein n=1 Tax=Morella rubra TaxID=262757 RepID=A0A6A1W7V9_9ROSI|nr:hypothetical protein CJ030_MR3G021770 [Morella rubra]KAB1220993.1 hypothetical protein CJ030_MR3G021773 [Morella rubra]
MSLNLKPRLGLIRFLLFFLSIFTIPLLSLADSDTTVYEMLPQFGLPSGLLPDSVVNYTFSSSDGRFVVSLANPCYVKFDYMVYYDKTITGKLSYGSITGLKGIQVQRFLLWLDVDEIRVDLPPSGSIYFQVGFINKKLDVSQFQTVHSCRNELSESCIKGVLELPTPVKEIEMLITE